MRVNLISPKSPVTVITKRETAIQFFRLSLTTVAALFPSDTDIRIVNDSLDEIDFDERVDMVGITTITSTAPRAYEIADRYREKGVPVILGGIHPTALPQEASLHADAVVIGEAEATMHRLLNDFRSGKLQKFYSSPERPNLVNLPLPRKDLLSGNKFYREMDLVQTTRGCPYACDFCSVSDFFGRTYRTRPISDVIKEVKQLRNRTIIFFVDDNIAGRPDYAKEFFKALIPLKIRWFGQASIVIAKNKELLRLAAKSGCKALFIGFESLSAASLKEVHKTVNRVQDYREGIKRIHDSGIGIIGAFMFGFDADNKGVFEDAVDFIERNKLEMASFSILTPLPGTRLYKRLDEEGRIFDRNWEKYTCGEVVFKPALMSVDQLQNGYYWVRKQISSYNSIFRRTSRFSKIALLSIPVNLVMRKASRASLRDIKVSKEIK
jgi:radical SAM superfamily enzyme YgiQ (UPF0313 family)